MESEIIGVWQYQLLDKKGLATEDGEPIEVIYPGRINDDQGADFRDAVIATSRGLMKGDVEVHVKSSSWRGHQHHRDAAYNRVVLHVVMWHNTKIATNLQSGGEIPVLALHKYMQIPPEPWSNWVPLPNALDMPCRKIARFLPPGALAGFLDKAGEERFLAKVTTFQTDLAQIEASQSLYQGIMGALGYSKNKLPFLELARRLPLGFLESISRSSMSDEECLNRQQAILLGTAGLLPSQYQDRHYRDGLGGKWVDTLEGLWASFHGADAMPPDAWHLFKVRPWNSPIRRLIAMSHLLIRYREKGIFEELINLVREVPVSRGYSRLEEGLLVTALGHGRAADITVNVLLPFTFAWSRFTSRPELESKAFDLYRCHPKLSVNSVERHMMTQLGLSNDPVNSAQRQQGLIHIYNSLCTQGRCSDCGLSQLESRNYVQS
ncbi:DUF2851 family protein [Chloroflexota bacterium]